MSPTGILHRQPPECKPPQAGRFARYRRQIDKVLEANENTAKFLQTNAYDCPAN
ncbi:MAG: hypothetical protein IPN33_14100 [Saprospiraceae bacterium]|nr:hypothetical protein [Saprospiraceae bacterium]